MARAEEESMPGIVIRRSIRSRYSANPSCRQRFVLGEAQGGVVESLQLVVQEKVGVCVQLRRQGIAQRLHMATDVMRERAEQLRSGQPGEESLEKTQAMGPEQIG